MNFVAIIPSLSALGPLGLLALIAPAAFAGLMLWMKRWKAALGAASVMSTVYLTQGWWQAWLRPSWWSTRAGFWLILALIGLGFCWWSARRFRRGESAGGTNLTRADKLIFGVAVAGVGFAVVCSFAMGNGFGSVGITALIAFAGVTAGLAALVSRGRAESVVVTALCVGCVLASLFETGRSIVSPGFRVEWVFEPDRAGAFYGHPCVTDEQVFVGAAHHDGFHQSGELYAVDRRAGKALWTWNNDQKLRPVFATPCFSNGRLYVGEGLHADSNCKLFCLDAMSGKKKWEFATTGHIESSPMVREGRVYFGAGDDGLYCLHAESGNALWHFENLHIDSSPLVTDGVVYVGSYRANDNRHTDLRLIALDAETGRTVWNVPIDLSSYNSPARSDNFVYFALGNGNLESGGPRPAGALVAVDEKTGRQVWRAEAPDSAFDFALPESSIVIGRRDGVLSSLNRKNGDSFWNRDLGSAIVGGPSFHVWGHDDTPLIVVTMKGRCVALDRSSGRMRVDFDLVQAVGGTSGQFISRPISDYLSGVGNRLYISGAVTRGIRESPCLICLTGGS